jgi:hypothetical protein
MDDADANECVMLMADLAVLTGKADALLDLLRWRVATGGSSGRLAQLLQAGLEKAKQGEVLVTAPLPEKPN